MSKIDPDAVTAVGDIDTTDEEAVVSYYKQLDQESNFWASVHTVGGFAYSPVLETGASLLRQQFELNAVSAFLCSREAVRHLLPLNKGGCIVNVAARPAFEPRNSSGLLAYTASKAAVAAMSQSLGEEVASHRKWVNAIAPSIMDTQANRQAMPDADFKKWVKVEEVAKTVAFLVSPQNECVLSAIIPAYGCEGL